MAMKPPHKVCMSYQERKGERNSPLERRNEGETWKEMKNSVGSALALKIDWQSTVFALVT